MVGNMRLELIVMCCIVVRTGQTNALPYSSQERERPIHETIILIMRRHHSLQVSLSMLKKAGY